MPYYNDYYRGALPGIQTTNPYNTPASITQQPVAVSQQPTVYNPIIAVVGRAGAESYPIGPGNTLVLMDTDPNSGLIFIKSRDTFGNNPILEVYKKVEEPKNQNEVNFVSQASFNELKDLVADLKKSIDELMK